MTEYHQTSPARDCASETDLAALRREVMVYRQGVQAENTRLRLEAEVGRVLNHYSRRTWIMGSTVIVLGVLNLSDMARAYANTIWWDLLFWPSNHGPGGFHPLQLLGLAWQVALVAYLLRWSRTPSWLDERVAHPKSLKDDSVEVELIEHLRQVRQE